MFEIVDGRQTDDGRTPEHGYTITPLVSLTAQVSKQKAKKLTTKTIVRCTPCLNKPWHNMVNSERLVNADITISGLLMNTNLGTIW